MSNQDLNGRRVFITGAARGIGAATARRLHSKGAKVAISGLEPELLAEVAASCGDAPWFECDVTDREQVDAAVEQSVERLGGLDVAIANAGTAAQMPIAGGNPEVMEKTVAVNVMGVYYTLRAAGPHLQHANGYALPIASLAAAVHAPLLGAYSASKAAVEALGNTLRIELRPYGARVGVGYFGELDTDMTSRGFGTEAAGVLQKNAPGNVAGHVAPLEKGIDAIEKGIRKRSRYVYAPGFVGPLLPFRMTAQYVVERATQRGLKEALAIAREEKVELTTPQ